MAFAVIDLPEGLSARPAGPADAGAMTELIAACELDADGVVEIELEDVVVTFRRSGFDPRSDTVLVFDGDALVAWAEVWNERAEVDVHPAHKGRGIGTRILASTEERARELGASRVGQTVTDANTAAIELFRRHDYVPRYTSWILEIRLDESPAAAPMLPEGIHVRMFEPGRDDEEVFRLIDDAFNEWPDRDEPWTYADWRALGIDRESFAPEVSPLAFDGDEVVGVALCSDVSGEGWINQIATKATHRHRGVARALLQQAFAGFYSRGKTVCGLNTDSRTGALGLYEKVGMHERRSYTRYSKKL